MQEGCEEFLLVPPFVAPDNLNRVRKSYILALVHARHVLCVHCESVDVLQGRLLWPESNGFALLVSGTHSDTRYQMQGHRHDMPRAYHKRVRYMRVRYMRACHMRAYHVRAYLCLVRAYDMRACHEQNSVSVSTRCCAKLQQAVCTCNGMTFDLINPNKFE